MEATGKSAERGWDQEGCEQVCGQGCVRRASESRGLSKGWDGHTRAWRDEGMRRPLKVTVTQAKGGPCTF